MAYTVIAVFLLALAFGGWGAWRALAPVPAMRRAQLRAQAGRIAALEQRVATLTRSDQISRDANRDLQGTLAERDEEVAGLRADVAFYERFVGSTAQRRGLNVHSPARAAPEWAGMAFHRHPDPEPQPRRRQQRAPDPVLEGSRNGRMQRVDWAQLRQQPDAAGWSIRSSISSRSRATCCFPPAAADPRARAAGAAGWRPGGAVVHVDRGDGQAGDGG